MMRRRRAIIIHDDPRVSRSLQEFFESRDYETAVFREFSICPVYGKRACPGPHRCGDLLIAGTSSLTALHTIDLIRAQQERGCGLAAENKAVIAGWITSAEQAVLDALGSRLLEWPLDRVELGRWVRACETHMDLDQPVAIRRRERRNAGAGGVLSVYLNGNTRERAVVVNRSVCGICVRTSRLLLPHQLVSLRADSLGIDDDASVRWVKDTGDGTFLAGISFCI
jgi:hypothetical protein